MDSLKTVTKYETVSTGSLEWEIEDVSLHVKKCDLCWNGTDHTSCYTDNSVTMNSVVMPLAAGDGNLSKWHFTLICSTAKTFYVGLVFDGLFGPAGAPLEKPLHFKYSTVTKKSLLGSAETITTSDGKECKEKGNQSIFYQAIPLVELKSVWPNGNLKISVEISHLSNIVHEVFNNGKFLDLLDLKDDSALPVPSCYGNLMTNPDLSDFKISCEGSIFPAHKLILSVRSPVFRAMIESGMKESSQNELKIQEMTVKTVKLMLEFLYKGTVQNFPEDLKEKIQLLDCAEKYELYGLKSICMRKIFSNLPTEKEVGELAMAAFTYGANSQVSKVIKDFCTMNYAKLIQNPEYKKLFLANPQAFMN